MAKAAAVDQLKALGLSLDGVDERTDRFSITNAMAIAIEERHGNEHLANIIVAFNDILPDECTKVRHRCLVNMKRLRKRFESYRKTPYSRRSDHSVDEELFSGEFRLSLHDLKSKNDDESARRNVETQTTPEQCKFAETQTTCSLSQLMHYRTALYLARRKVVRAKRTARLKTRTIAELNRNNRILEERLRRGVAENASLKETITAMRQNTDNKESAWHNNNMDESLETQPSPEVTVKTSSGFTPEMRLCMLELKRFGVSDNNVSHCINAVADMLGKRVNATPSRRTVARISSATKALAQQQAGPPAMDATEQEPIVTVSNDEPAFKPPKLERSVFD